jgi:hypothetical protein
MTITSRPASKEYRDNFESTFGRKAETPSADKQSTDDRIADDADLEKRNAQVRKSR